MTVTGVGRVLNYGALYWGEGSNVVWVVWNSLLGVWNSLKGVWNNLKGVWNDLRRVWNNLKGVWIYEVALNEVATF